MAPEGVPPARASAGVPDAQRFQLELEFVQSLANPAYLNWLAQNRMFDEPCFVEYLAYLRYWKRPEYAHYLTYPMCLHFLDLLQTKQFRQSIANAAVKETVHTQQFRFWQFYQQNRLRENAAAAEAAGGKGSGDDGQS